MRRGLLAWSEDEVPRAVLDARVVRYQAAMHDAGLDALLLYTNFPRPAAVSYLTHFVPYWSQGVLLVPPAGAPTLFVSLSKRVGGWIEETSHIAEVVCTPRLGAEIAAFMGSVSTGAPNLGVLELAKLPGGIAGPLAQGLPGARLTDATDLFRRCRHPTDDAEIALSRRAAEIARHALDAAGSGERDGSAAPLIAAIEGPARIEGAEEVLVLVAPDLESDTRLIHPEGDVPLGRRFAVQVSVAYKAHWVRLARTFTRDRAEADRLSEAAIVLQDRLTGPWANDDLGAAVRQAVKALPGACLGSWRAEACIGSAPLNPLQDDTAASHPVPPGGVVSITARIDSGDGPWLFGEPFVTPPDGVDAARPLLES